MPAQTRQYAWVEGCRLGGNPQIVGEELDRLAEGQEGPLTPEQVVEAAKSPRSPLHGLFEWDVNRAAKLHWEQQARHIMRSVRIVAETDEGDVGVMVYIHSEDATGRGYFQVDKVVSSAELKARALAEAKKQLDGFRRRYKHLSELEQVFRAIEGLE